MSNSNSQRTTTHADGLAPPAPARGLARKLLLVTTSALAVYAVMVVVADRDEVMRQVNRLPGSLIALALTLATASFVVRFGRWQFYLRALGIRVRIADSALIFATGLGMSVTPGKAGELLKAVMLRDAANVPLTTSAPIVVAERITDTMALLLLGALGMVGRPGGVILLSLAVGAVLVLSALLGSRRAGRWAIDQAARVRFVARNRERVLQAHDSLTTLCSPGLLLVGGATALLAWAIHCRCLLVVASGFHGVSLGFGDAMVSNAAPLLAGALAMIPGGIGLTEASMTGALMAFATGISSSTAAAMTIVFRVITLWWAVFIGIVALLVWHARAGSRPAAAAAECVAPSTARHG